MKIELVPAAWVHRTWPAAEEFIASALIHAPDEYTIADAKALVTLGSWSLIIAIDGEKLAGAMTVNMFNRPHDRVAFITATGGEFVTDQGTFDQLRVILRGLGATVIETGTRPAMARMLEKFGFKEKYQIVGVSI